MAIMLAVAAVGGSMADPASFAVGETVILLHHPSPVSRCFNRHVKGVSAK